MRAEELNRINWRADAESAALVMLELASDRRWYGILPREFLLFLLTWELNVPTRDDRSGTKRNRFICIDKLLVTRERYVLLEKLLETLRKLI